MDEHGYPRNNERKQGPAKAIRKGPAYWLI